MTRLEIIIHWSILAFLFVLPLPGVPALLANIFALGVLAWITKSLILRKFHFQLTSLFPLILWIGISIFISSILSIDKSYSLKLIKSEYLFYTALYFFLVNNIKDFEQIKKMVKVLIFSILLISIYGIYGYLSETRIIMANPVGKRAISIFNSFGEAAFYTSFIFPLLIAQIAGQKGWRRILLFLLSLIVLIFLILTFSRGSWLAVALAIGVLSFARFKKLFILLLLFIIGGFLLFPHQFTFRLSDTYIGDRPLLWTSAVKIILDHPLFGIGYGDLNFSKLYPAYLSGKPSEKLLPNAHNFYLQLLVELGVFGFAAFFALVADIIMRTIIMVKGSISDSEKNILWGILGCWVVFFTFGMTTYRYQNKISLLFWCYIAIIMKLFELKKRVANSK